MKRIVSNTEMVWIATPLCAALLALVAGCAVGPEFSPPGPSDHQIIWGSPHVEGVDWRPADTPPDDTLDPPEPTWCDDVIFPPPNVPDGCFRLLLSKDNTGAPFNASSAEPTLARYGDLVAFTVLPTEEFGVNGLSSDTNQFRDVYSVDLRAYQNPLRLVSINNQGEVGDGDSFEPSVSGSGRFVAFTSYAKNLTSHAHEGYSGIFVRDRVEQHTKLVSRPSQNTALPNGDSYNPLISADGRLVIFLSRASNLVEGDNNGSVDLFLRDRYHGTTVRLSVDQDGHEVNQDAQRAVGISDNNQFVLFSHPSLLTEHVVRGRRTEHDQYSDAYRLDRVSNTLTMISYHAKGKPLEGAHSVALSADGSKALLHVGRVETLVPNDGSISGPGSVIAKIQDSGIEFELVKLGPGKPLGMCARGSKVIFSSTSPGYVPNVQLLNDEMTTANAYVFDREADLTHLLTADTNGTPGVIHDYDEPGVRAKDWVAASMGGAGDRFVMSSIQYGLVHHPALHCSRFRPRLIYLVSCNRADY